jgi:hypothetical protein
MANLAIGQGLNADAGLSALVYAHEVALEQKSKHLAPSVSQKFEEYQISVPDGKSIPARRII